VYFDEDCEGDQYLDWRAGIMFPCVNGFPVDGTLVPKHVGADTVNWTLGVLFSILLSACGG